MTLLKKYFNKILINHPNEEIYCLKVDISKYFYSINHEILLNLLEKNIADKDVINLIKIIISETNNQYVNDKIKIYNQKYNLDIPYYVEHTGLSIGAMSSQFLAIFYLNTLDHYIKEELGCKYYIRYMDDFLIIDRDKEKLKYCYQEITKKIEELKLKVNKKSNLYRCNKGFSFLGYTYKVFNNKLHISCKKDTYIRIQKKLAYLKEFDIIQYRKTMGSYYGYFESGTKIEREKLKMTTNELYNSYKRQYNNYLVIIKEKNFYKTFSQDAKIIWYLFNYKINNQTISFGNNAYDKVINKLKDMNINFIIASKIEKLLCYFTKESAYLSYCELACKSYQNLEKEKILITKLKTIIKENSNYYDDIYKFLCKIEENK